MEGEGSDGAERQQCHLIPHKLWLEMACVGFKGDRKEEGFVKEAFEDLSDANPGCGGTVDKAARTERPRVQRHLCLAKQTVP